ncbi:MAG: hypothetical protein ABI165_14555 [Bryobacteraceae bacterium]
MKFDSGFAAVVALFDHDPHVTRGEGKGFGSHALKADGKIFAMMSSKGQFVVKLSKARADELAAAGQGEYFDPGHGRLMKQWLTVPPGKADWANLAKEARRFAGSASP